MILEPHQSIPSLRLTVRICANIHKKAEVFPTKSMDKISSWTFGEQYGTIHWPFGEQCADRGKPVIPIRGKPCADAICFERDCASSCRSPRSDRTLPPWSNAIWWWPRWLSQGCLTQQHCLTGLIVKSVDQRFQVWCFLKNSYSPRIRQIVFHNLELKGWLLQFQQ